MRPRWTKEGWEVVGTRSEINRLQEVVSDILMPLSVLTTNVQEQASDSIICLNDIIDELTPGAAPLEDEEEATVKPEEGGDEGAGEEQLPPPLDGTCPCSAGYCDDTPEDTLEDAVLEDADEAAPPEVVTRRRRPKASK